MYFCAGKTHDSALRPLLDRFRIGGGVSPVVSDEYLVFPGLCDVHVHLREPGFSYKERIRSGSLAGARSGYTALCPMPNLNPVPYSLPNLKLELDLIRKDALQSIRPYGAISVGEAGKQLADLEGMAPYVCAFSDDGKGVQDRSFMREAMLRAKALNKIIAAHCEDNTLLHGGYIHDGWYAKTNGHRGICSESEWRQIERDLELAADTGVRYHVCHISTKESVELIRQAKKSGVDVTCETGPHYLVLSDRDLQEDGRFKMNLPLRDESDREALLEGIADGTVDMIATDHAPHSAEEKSRGLAGSAFGITGLETAFPVLYTRLVKPGLLSLERLCELMCTKPRARFGLPLNGDDFTVFDVREPWSIDPAQFASQGKSTPFAGWTVYGRCVATVYGGKLIWQENSTEN